MANKAPKEYTLEEMRGMFIKKIHQIVKYWKNVELKDTPAHEQLQTRLDGLAFSILVMLDGGYLELPEFIVAPNPHPDDKEFCISEGENYFPMPQMVFDKHGSEVTTNIGGYLHELYHSY
jgi:hypothetical protein